MLFDERSLEDEGFDFIVSNDKFNIGNLPDEFFGLNAVTELAGASSLKIRAHTIAQVLGFADIDDLSRGVLVQVNTGRARNFFEFLVERHFVLMN